MSDSESRIELSLVSHTNVGKTTLARTLLGRDIGEVRDAPHVTALSEPHEMITSPAGYVLTLWDTPGFGDSIRLAKRLGQRSNPIGWFIAEIWDRWRDQSSWSSQQVIKNVRDQSDIVLYLVNASENPADAAYVLAEMEILSWIEKPVLVLLNQMGEPRPKVVEEAEKHQWHDYVAKFGFVKDVLTLDAFARCWVQEFSLLNAVADALPDYKKPAIRSLREAWMTLRLEAYHASTAAISRYLASLARDHERVADGDLSSRFKKVGRAIGIGKGDEATEEMRTMKILEERAAQALRELTNQLIDTHGLKGRAVEQVLKRLAADWRIDEPLSEGRFAVVGGILSGALSGLATDIISGGLTLGTGTLAGAALGALSAAGVAKGYNVYKGKDGTTVSWNAGALDRILKESLLLYLAVAHYGRGRGEWSRSEHPAHWGSTIESAVESQSPALEEIWSSRGELAKAGSLEEKLGNVIDKMLRFSLNQLYPEAKVFPVEDRIHHDNVRDFQMG
ncbi:MAG: GTPase domain-containing protein [Azonexus sp.]